MVIAELKTVNLFNILTKFRMFYTGIPADLFVLPSDAYGDGKNNKNNSCYDTDSYEAVKGLQNISPCQYGNKYLKKKNIRSMVTLCITLNITYL